MMYVENKWSEVIRAGLVLSFPGLEQEPVHCSGHNAAQDGARPVHPVIVPRSCYNGRSKCTSRVHAGACVFYCSQVTGGDGEADGQGGRSLHVGSPVVTHSLHSEHQNESDEGLHEETLQWSHETTDGRHAQRVPHVFGGQSLQHSGSGNCTDALNGNVKDSLENTDVPGDEESARDGWVDVAPAHVPHSLHYRGNSQSESEGDLDDAGRGVPWSNTAAANQDEEERSQEFSRQHAPYVAVVRDVVQPNHSPCTCWLSHD